MELKTLKEIYREADKNTIKEIKIEDKRLFKSISIGATIILGLLITYSLFFNDNDLLELIPKLVISTIIGVLGLGFVLYSSTKAIESISEEE